MSNVLFYLSDVAYFSIFLIYGVVFLIAIKYYFTKHNMSTNCMLYKHFLLVVNGKNQIDYKLKMLEAELITTNMLKLVTITLKYRN